LLHVVPLAALSASSSSPAAAIDNFQNNRGTKGAPATLVTLVFLKGVSLSGVLARVPDAQEKYRLLVDAITDYAIYMLDRDGTVVSWNTGAAKFKGYSATEILGRPASRLARTGA
jgi:PAS domain-containing protein